MEIFGAERLESSAGQVVILAKTEEDDNDDNTMNVCTHIHDSLVLVFIACRISNLVGFSVKFWTNTYSNRHPLRIYNIVIVVVHGLNSNVNMWLDW
ncbi:MAG: hypothetical protein QOK89_03980 [Nitrososphaeraceae archaeon]|nr:hypothetical protein [Nitrososphaeraceae archaeon]